MSFPHIQDESVLQPKHGGLNLAPADCGEALEHRCADGTLENLH